MRARMLLCVPSLIVGVPAAGQGLYADPAAATGMVARGFHFRQGVGARTASQVMVPLAIAIPVGRQLSVEVASSWAWSRLTTYDGGEASLAGITDTELRAAWTVGRDRALFTLSANLPTGRGTLDAEDLTVVGAIGSNFLTFPVSSYGSGLSLTAGGALTQRAGGLNLGFGVSARVAGGYEPFEGLPIEYQPGLETRVQLAADALLGRGRVSGGVTFSTFGSDNFAGNVTDVGVSQAYQPGSRWIFELGLIQPLGPGMLSLGLFDFLRGAAGADGTAVVGSRENIGGLGAEWRVAVGGGLAVAPGAELRQWWRDGGVAGRLTSLGLELEAALGARFALLPQLRTDFGFINGPSGQAVRVQGWTLGLMGQIEFR